MSLTKVEEQLGEIVMRLNKSRNMSDVSKYTVESYDVLIDMLGDYIKLGLPLNTPVAYLEVRKGISFFTMLSSRNLHSASKFVYANVRCNLSDSLREEAKVVCKCVNSGPDITGQETITQMMEALVRHRNASITFEVK